MLINPLRPYLTWPQFVKLKEIKPLTLENQVKKYKQYINEIAFQEQQFLIRQGLTQGGPSSTPPSVVTGVKCIAANNEYLSSPAGNYFGGSIDGLVISAEIIEKTTFGYYVTQSVDGSNFIMLRNLGNSFSLWIANGGSDWQDIQDIGFSNGDTIKFVGVGTNLQYYLNDVLVYTADASSVVMPDLSSAELKFSANNTNEFNSTLGSIKINTHEWNASNWTSPTTTNSQGVVTTLYSDVSTDAMIVRT